MGSWQVLVEVAVMLWLYSALHAGEYLHVVTQPWLIFFWLSDHLQVTGNRELCVFCASFWSSYWLWFRSLYLNLTWKYFPTWKMSWAHYDSKQNFGKWFQARNYSPLRTVLIMEFYIGLNNLRNPLDRLWIVHWYQTFVLRDSI